MGQADIQIIKIDGLCELESQVNKEQLILCDDMQNKFFIISFNNVHILGVAYYDYGTALEIQFSRDDTLLYLGAGKNFLCIDTYENKVLINDKLQSVFYELCYDINMDYVCVVCELDVYCYYLRRQKWKRGFGDIIVGYNIIDNNKISIKCDDESEYMLLLEDGSMTE